MALGRYPVFGAWTLRVLPCLNLQTGPVLRMRGQELRDSRMQGLRT